jgi:CheY-like chemotaxis protein
MHRTSDDPVHTLPDVLTAAPGSMPAATASPTAAARVLIVDADPALHGLLQEWLSAAGCHVVQFDGEAGSPVEPFDLVIVDVPYPRQGGVDLIARIKKRHPMTPILALSSTFFGRIECCGPVAHALGVACVLPTPLARQVLLDAVRRFVSLQ